MLCLSSEFLLYVLTHYLVLGQPTGQMNEPECLIELKKQEEVKRMIETGKIDDLGIEQILATVQDLIIKGFSYIPRIKEKTLDPDNFRKSFYRYFLQEKKTGCSIHFKYINLLYLYEGGYRIEDQYDIQILKDDAALWYKWDEHEKERVRSFNKTSNLKVNEEILGVWHVYFKDSEGVHRTFLKVSLDNEQLLANYISVKGILLEGIVKHKNNQLIIDLHNQNEDYFMSLRGRLDNLMLKQGNVQITGIAIVNEQYQTQGLPFILFKPSGTSRDFKVFKDFQDDMSFETAVSIKEPATEGAIFTPKLGEEMEMVSYLDMCRYVMSPDRQSKRVGISDWILEITTKKGRLSFEKFGSQFKEIDEEWISLTRRDEGNDKNLTVYCWKIEKCNYDQSISVSRSKRFKSKDWYSGEMRIYNDNYWICLSDNIHNQKYLYGYQDKDAPNCILLLASAKIGDRRHTVRELLFPKSYLPEGFEVEAGTILPYEDFLQMKDLPSRLKMYLNHRSHSVLSFPLSEGYGSGYYQQKRASRFSGKYLLFIKSPYKEDNGTLLKWQLKIDVIAGTRLIKKYTDDGPTYYYSGIAEHLNKSLYLHLSHDNITPTVNQEKKQACRIMFYVKDGYVDTPKDKLLVGVFMDSDLEFYPSAHLCFALKLDQTDTESELEPVVTDEDLTQLKRIFRDTCMDQYASKFSADMDSLEDFFQNTSGEPGRIILHDIFN